MRVVARDFEATKDDPFRQDLLNRRPHVDALCGVIQRIQGHAVVSIEGSWGSGKTAFVKMCAARLRQQDVQVVFFNAWKESYTNNPLMDLVSVIASGIGGSWTSRTRQAFTDTGWIIARLASRGAIDRGSFRKADTPRFPEWEKARKTLGRFDKCLKRIASPTNPGDGWRTLFQWRRKRGARLGAGATGGGIVVLIDELDRCRPDYALGLIEAVRNLFAVDGIVVLLAINREELCHSIQSLYGAEFDTDRYLRRFVDLPYTLPPPSEDHLSAFALELLSAANVDSRVLSSSEPHHPGPRMLGKIPTAANHNLRDLQQSIHSTSAAMHAMGIESGEDLDKRATERKIVALIVLRALDKTAFQNLAYGDRDAFAAVAAMNRAITSDPETLEDHSNRDRSHQMIEASLLAESYVTILSKKNVAFDRAKAQDAFIRRYTTAFRKRFPGLSDEAGKVRAGWIFQMTAEDAVRATAPCPKTEELVGIIDLIAYKPPWR